MPDRENVIKGLEQFIADFKPFCGNKSDWQRVDDALALLKAQEPRPARIEGGDMIQVGYCPNCGKLLQPWGAKYCYECGQAVKWE